MTQLYVLTNQYLALAEKLADGDFDLQTIADTIEASGISDELAVKAESLEYVARGAEAYNGAIDAEIARLQALKASRIKVAAGLREYLKVNMERAGISKIECPMFKISVRDNPLSVEVMDPLSLPAEYMTQPPTPAPVPNKTAIKEAINSGKEVSGARLTKQTRLVIK